MAQKNNIARSFNYFLHTLLFFLILLQGMPLYGQKTGIRGHVKSSLGEALPGATVAIKGTTIGTITDLSGNFTLEINPDTHDTLVVSFVGYLSQLVEIGNNRFFEISLDEENLLIDELVVIGYGIQKKADLTGSVSSIDMEDLSRVPVAGIDQALQGLASGVTVTQNTGAPGEGVKVRIRGVGSINSGNSPLYIVDGIPTEDAMNSLSSNDIESLSILKDAASAAIYGSRANNGVVLITTKKGKAGKPGVQLNAMSGIQVHGPLTEMADKYEYAEIYNEAARNDNEDIESELLKRKLISDSLIETSSNVNHLEEIFRPAWIHDYNLSVNGGNEKNSFLISGSYFNQEGILLNSNYERYSAKVSLTSKTKRRLSIGSNMNFSKTTTNIVGSSGDGYGGNGGSAVRYAFFRCPTIPVYDENGDYTDLPDQSDLFGDGYNPVGLLENTLNKKGTYRAFGDVFATVDLLDGLSFTSRFGVDQYSYNQRRFNKTWGTNDRINNPNSLTVSDGLFTSWTWNNVLNYYLDLNDIHHFNIMAGTEAIKENGYNNETTEKDYTDQDPNVVYLGNGQGSISTSETRWGCGLLSFFTRLNYDYNGKYLISATLREDGSSRFAEGKRWGTFYSASAGWRIDREPFMESIDFVSQWKIRAGVGFIGNQDIGYYAYTDQISSGYNYSFGDISQDGYATSAFGNENVQWETSSQYDIGTDITLFQGQLNLTVDYYLKITRDMLTQESLPTSAGYSDPAWVNSGEIWNSGLEVEASYQKIMGDFRFITTVNISTLKNEVKDLASPIYGGRIDNGVYATKTEEGYPVGSFYLYEMEGIFQNEKEIVTHAYQGEDIKPGDVMFKDQDGNGIINANDRVHVGSAIPEFTAGFNFNAGYKNIDMVVFFQGAFGQEIYYQVATDIEGFYRPFNVTQRYYDERWTGEGTSNKQPRASWDAKSNNAKPSTRFLEDGSYLRLKSLQVGYTLPAKLSQKLSLEKCRIYFSGLNLWTWTRYPGLDPEMTTSDNSTSEGDRAAGIDWGTYPSAVAYNLGLQISF